MGRIREHPDQEYNTEDGGLCVHLIKTRWERRRNLTGCRVRMNQCLLHAGRGNVGGTGPRGNGQQDLLSSGRRPYILNDWRSMCLALVLVNLVVYDMLRFVRIFAYRRIDT